MAMVGSAIVGGAIVGWAQPAQSPPAPIIWSTNTVEVTLAGVAIPSDTLLSVRCSYGWDKPVSEAEIVLSDRPSTGTYSDNVVVTVNGVVRFRGLLFDWDYGNWPQSVGIRAFSELHKAELYLNEIGDLDPDEGKPGLSLDVLLGGPTSGTLRDIVTAVLNVCGVSYTLSNLADPPHVYGLIAPEEFTWQMNESGLAYLHRLFEASAGYRVFSSGDGELYMAQIVGRPRPAPPDLWLTSGVDILEGAKAGRSVEKTRNAVVVKGYDDGEGDGPLQYPITPFVNAPNAVQPGPTLFSITISSPLIEDLDFAQVLCDTYWTQEVSREFVTCTLSTWRDDVIGPAQTHTVDALGRLGVGEPLWVLSNTLEVDERGCLTQQISYGGGGLDPNAVPVPF